MPHRCSILVVTLVFLAALLSVTILGDTPDGQWNLVDANWTIRRPPDFLDRHTTLGTYMGLAPNGNEMHYTYASPGSAEFYRKNKRFADATVLVKDEFATTHAQLTTGDAHWAKGTKVRFVMIKDDKKRFPDNPLWGPSDRVDRAR